MDKSRMFYLYKWTPQGLKVMCADMSIVHLMAANRLVGGFIREGK